RWRPSATTPSIVSSGSSRGPEPASGAARRHPLPEPHEALYQARRLLHRSPHRPVLDRAAVRGPGHGRRRHEVPRVPRAQPDRRPPPRGRHPPPRARPPPRPPRHPPPPAPPPPPRPPPPQRGPHHPPRVQPRPAPLVQPPARRPHTPPPPYPASRRGSRIHIE